MHPSSFSSSEATLYHKHTSTLSHLHSFAHSLSLSLTLTLKRGVYVPACVRVCSPGQEALVTLLLLCHLFSLSLTLSLTLSTNMHKDTGQRLSLLLFATSRRERERERKTLESRNGTLKPQAKRALADSVSPLVPVPVQSADVFGCAPMQCVVL